MAMYRICAVCIACGGLHTMETTISLPLGPLDKQSIREAYSNKDPPLQVAALSTCECIALRPDDTTHRETITKYSSFRLPSIFDPG